MIRLNRLFWTYCVHAGAQASKHSTPGDRPSWVNASCVLPSLSEGSPNVLLESMAARVPIVATSVGGVTEIVNHDESAILVRSANAGMLGKAMVAILQDSQRAKRLADVAFERVCSMFSPAKYDERMLALYERAAYRRF